MCLGSLEFRFRQQRKELGAVTLHHGVSLRWQPFFDNAALADPEPLLDWLSARGITSEREEYEEARREDAEFEAAKARWRAAIPEALEPHWDTMRELRLEWPELNDVLTAAHPEPVGRARVLFRWLGHGRGPWSGFPTYETVPEWCLLQVPLDALLEAAQAAPEDELLREGAARLFAGWSFATERRDDVEMIPADVRRMLLAHALASSDEDKRDRARAAFE
jgi:hypothetical protein